MKALKHNKTFRSYLSTIMDESDTEKYAQVVDDLEEIAALVIRINDNKSHASKDGCCANLVSAHQSDGTNSYFRAATDNDAYNRLSSHVLQPPKYSKNMFFGIFINTGCALASGGGVKQ